MYDALENVPRLLIQAALRPVQGSRFQPTGFPDLGAAEYKVGDDLVVLVESAQSMANRLEAVCWDEAADDWVPELRGLPYVRVSLPDDAETTSVQEAHRLNSPFITKADGFDVIKDAIGFKKDAPYARRKLSAALLKYDVNALLHGIFLEKIAGTLRLPRAISAFIEATNVGIAASGGVKFDRVQPETSDTTPYGKAADGFGNVPFHREEYTGDITAYFNVDLQQIRAYGFAPEVTTLLTTWSLYKIQRFLTYGLRLRTACDLDVVERSVTRPHGFELPSLEALESALPVQIAECGAHFASPPVTRLTFSK